MLKRSFMIVTLLGSMVPMAAFAGNISTRVMTAGGTATMGAGTAQTSAAGTVTKFFGTGKYYNTSGVLVPQVDAGTTVAFAPNAAAGYVVSEVKLNGIVIPNAVSPVTVPAAAKGQSVTIKFARQTVAITANAAVGGSVIPGGTKSGIVGTPLTYVFTPFNGASVQSIAGLPSGYALTNAVTHAAVASLPYAGPVAVTFTPVAGTNVTMTPSFLAITASAGSAQTVATGTAVTLAGTSSASDATFAWTQVGGPSLGNPWTASIANPSFPSGLAAGNYTFQVIATSVTAGVSTPSAVVITAKANYVPLSVSQTARVQCENCHSAQGVGAGIFSAYSSSIHGQSSHSLCSACHNGTLTGSHPGSVNAASVSKTTFLVLQNGVVGGNGNVVNTGDLFCTTCHNGAHPVPHPITGLETTCQACHTTAGTGDAHQLQPAGVVTLTVCTPCHTNGVTPAALQSGANCAICHNTLQVHLFTDTSTIATGADNCVGCHDKSIHASFANNSGARIIVGANGEFGGATGRQNASGYRSHHIYNGANVDPDNAQCIVCHLEGKVDTDKHTVRIDKTYHMADHKIHLRSGNTDIVANVVFDPAGPDHTALDNFCMSCHNAAGAKSVYTNISGALLASAKVQANMTAGAANRPSAKNPFGDLLTNAYDSLVRTAVVAVYEQFDTGNTSHHAVRGKKYTTRYKTGSTYVDANGTTGAALFTQYSGASVGSIRISPTTGLPTAVREVFGNYTATYGASGMGAKTPGSRHTIYESTLFTSAFQTLGGDTLGDDSTLHCGDCHTVGQWKPASAKNADGSATAVTIGAHGSKNEYMLRTSNGSDALMTANTAVNGTVSYGTNNQALPGTILTNGTLVCYLCHKQEAYTGNVSYFRYTDPLTGATSKAVHVGQSSGDCNDSKYLSTGKTGYANRVGALGAEKSVFGIQCLTCHGGNTQIFGGIHGNASSYGDQKNIGYKTYSTNGKDAMTTAAAGLKPASGGIASPAGTGNSENRNAQLTIVTRTPYRFAGGTSLKYNGGGTASKWEAKAMTKQHREGCYNLQASTTGANQWSGADGSQLIVPDYYNAKDGGAASLPAVTSGSGPDDLSTTQNNGVASGWGSCSHHAGSNATGSNNTSARQIQRPLNY